MDNKIFLNYTTSFLLLWLCITPLMIVCGVDGEEEIINKNKIEKKSSRNNNVIGPDDPNAIFPMVTTPLGQLRGQAKQSRAGRWYYAFSGIPFAEPPQRFKAAAPVQPWEGILDARGNCSMCPQMDFYGAGLLGDENCLFVNVDFPHYDRCQNETANGLLPVMFNIHGGGFTGAAGIMFGSKYLMDECIVYVSINYRLGALGFLTTGDDVIPGNLGLKDMVLALNWTRDHISHFRGDPDSVTVMGISAGGFAVAHLVTSPMAKGLFQRAIAQSGSTILPWTIQRHAAHHATALGLKLNCSVQSSEALKKCLESKDVLDIISNQANPNGKLMSFGPTIEPNFAEMPFQTQNPAILLQTGDFNRVPLITGFMQDEGITLFAGSVLMDPNKTSLLNNSWESTAPDFFLYDDLDLDQSELNRISTDIRQFYFGSNSIGQETRQNLVNLYSDRYFIQGTFATVELYAKFAPVYPYVMTYKGGASSSSGVGYEIPASSHGDDGQFLFEAFGQKGFNVGTDQFQFSRQLIRHWTEFAKTGQPLSLFGEPWNATVGAANSNWHQLDLAERNLVNYLDERRTFWKNLGLLQHDMK